MKKYIILSLIFWCHIQAIGLFKQFPELEDKIAYISLANLPTPITQCHNLEKALGHHPLFLKNDGLTSRSKNLYGGNKVRKLEFLLADAQQKGMSKIITFGCAGTNHGLAAACYAKQLGFVCLLMLKHQPNSPVVRQNLLLDTYFGAPIQLFHNNAERKIALDALLKDKNDTYFIPTGGSVALGALGYVNAAFELKEQIQKEIMPEPDFIYLPIGSCGTAAGLLLGLKLAGINSKIMAIVVEPEEEIDEFEINTKKLFSETNQFLNSLSINIPLFEFPHEQLIINKDFCGTQYGRWLRVGDDATRLIKNEEGITVEGTYSAKPVAALIADIKHNKINKDAVILLWNTYCGLDFSHLTSQVDYKQLNPALYHYFEDAQLVNMQQTYPDILLDLKFATPDNFTGKTLYGKYECLLLKPVAQNLNEAAKEFKTLGYTVKIWDGYRPVKASATLWQIMPDDNFIANPKDGGSRHNRGCAVDLTLVDKDGLELDMGTYFCQFSKKTYRSCQDLPEHILKNRKLLEIVMQKHGFVGLPTEWWHFDYKDWLQYPILDVSLDS